MIAVFAAALAGAGTTITLAGLALVLRFARRFARHGPPAPAALPPVTLLKPLHGDETLLETALATACAQDYPDYQIVFGVRDPADPALLTVRRLQARFPACDIAVVTDARRHGANGKVGNLINMLPYAKHDLLVIADSDVHASPDCLRRLAAALAAPGVGLATMLYTGLPASGALADRLGAAQITYGMLPGALLARALGRQDCLGATMALRRETLARVGGFAALANHLADDNVLGRLVRAQGLAIALAPGVVATTVADRRLAALWAHELRWARTIRALAPAGFAASVLQYPLFWSALALLAAGGAPWSIALLAAVWALRAAAARGIDRALGLANAAPVWLLPLRELLSVAVLIAGFLGDRVQWRDERLVADDGRTAQMPETG